MKSWRANNFHELLSNPLTLSYDVNMVSHKGRPLSSPCYYCLAGKLTLVHHLFPFEVWPKTSYQRLCCCSFKRQDILEEASKQRLEITYLAISQTYLAKFIYFFEKCWLVPLMKLENKSQSTRSIDTKQNTVCNNLKCCTQYGFNVSVLTIVNIHIPHIL